MSTGVGLIVLAAIFAFGVALFGLLAIVLLPGAIVIEDALQGLRARRAARSTRKNA
jgi:hypothetical protein